MSAEILELSGNVARDNKVTVIENSHINNAINDDDELLKVIEKAGIIFAD